MSPRTGSQARIVDTEALALDPSDPEAFQPNAADHIALSAGGPGGVVLDPAERPPLRVHALR